MSRPFIATTLGLLVCVGTGVTICRGIIPHRPEGSRSSAHQAVASEPNPQRHASRVTFSTDALTVKITEQADGPRFEVTRKSDQLQVANALTLDQLQYEFPDLRKKYDEIQRRLLARPLGN